MDREIGTDSSSRALTIAWHATVIPPVSSMPPRHFVRAATAIGRQPCEAAARRKGTIGTQGRNATAILLAPLRGSFRIKRANVVT